MSPVVEALRYATKAVFVVLAVVSRTPRGTRRWTRLVPAGGAVAASVKAPATSPAAAATSGGLACHRHCGGNDGSHAY